MMLKHVWLAVLLLAANAERQSAAAGSDAKFDLTIGGETRSFTEGTC
jgi:hypothetical protein